MKIVRVESQFVLNKNLFKKVQLLKEKVTFVFIPFQ